jgi:putative photosynthetic complex assembly protein 2
MVNLSALILPLLAVTVLWFVSTGLVAMIHHRMRQSYAMALMIAGGCAVAGLGLIMLSVHATSTWAIYTSCLGGLLIWAWHEISFLTGAVAGTHRDACPENASGWQRFSMATLALVHHEIALVMTAGLLLSLAAVSTNATGAYIFALLLIFRLLAKLNLFWGVPNFSAELLPRHMRYLTSYFGPKRLAAALPISILLLGGCAAYFTVAATYADQAHIMVQASLLAGLSALAALEHIFLAIPFRDSALWGWAMGRNT